MRRATLTFARLGLLVVFVLLVVGMDEAFAPENPERGYAAPSAFSVMPPVIDSEYAALVSLYKPSPLDAALYRSAMAARAVNDNVTAESQFRIVAQQGGMLSPLAAVREAQAIAAQGRYTDATIAFGALLELKALPEVLRNAVRRDDAVALQRAGRPADAIRLLEQIGDAPARWQAAILRRAQGDGGWVADAVAAVAAAPGTRTAYDAMTALNGAGADIPPMIEAYERYLINDNDGATALYSSVAANPPDAATAAKAWFYLGALAERYSNPDGALDFYTRCIKLDPAGEKADDARWWRALIYEQVGNQRLASSEYKALVNDYPRSPFAYSAAMKAAFVDANTGNRAEAAGSLRRIASSQKGEQGAMAARWLSVLGLAAPGDPRPSDIDPTSLAAVLDLSGGSAMDSLPSGALEEWGWPGIDWSAVEPWMAAHFGSRGADSAMLQDPSLHVGLALSSVDPNAGRSMIRELLGQFSDKPYALLDLARLTSAAKMTDIAMAAASMLLDKLPPAQRLQAPFAVLQLAYPAPYENEVREAASAEGVPPLLLLALVRQESAFNAQAGSSAGAMGLTQVMPATGAAIAVSLGVPWNAASLYDPETSLRFGANYLGSQLRRNSGNIFMALAAYNGGPGNAQRWRSAQATPGAEGYLLAVDYTETKAYLERVVTNYAMYRYLYGGAARPSIR